MIIIYFIVTLVKNLFIQLIIIHLFKHLKIQILLTDETFLLLLSCAPSVLKMLSPEEQIYEAKHSNVSVINNNYFS